MRYGDATQSLGHPGGTGPRAVHRGAGRDDRERRAAPHPGGPELLRRLPAVGDQRVHAALRRLPAARRPDGRPARAAPGVHRRPAAVRRHLAGRGAVQLARVPDRGPGGPGARRRAAVARRAGDPDHDLRARSRTQHRDGRLGRSGRPRRDARRRRRRRTGRLAELAVGVLRERADRARTDRADPGLRPRHPARRGSDRTFDTLGRRTRHDRPAGSRVRRGAVGAVRVGIVRGRSAY